MDSYQFYKSLYDRELNRRKDLDSSINLPITILTILVAANLYLIEKLELVGEVYYIIIENCLLTLIFVSFFVSVFFLTRSYNNLFKGFGYRNLGFSKKIRDFEIIEIPKFNNQVDEVAKINFEKMLITKLTEITDDHIRFNDKRSLDLYKAKTFIIVVLILTAIKFLIVIINNLSL